MIVNRIGDFMLFIAIILLVREFRTLDYLAIYSLVEDLSNEWFSPFGFKFLGFYDLNLVFFFGGLVLIGAVSKSAQLGLHT